ncbi:lytic transglycosylase domain-containing protein [Pedococcus ginsenosidimutans]|uniref:lytic transglycosylase domain-containing protein n=1 Tax=Pedococcus ginsenosidimutans TaxID=490570 RepID=UPI0031E90CE4
MAETPHSPGPRVFRLSVGRPATTVLSAVVLGGALLVGGGAASGPPPSAGATASPTTSAATARATSLPEDWDVTQRDLLVGQRREGALAFTQVLATRLGAPLVATGAALGSTGTGGAPLSGPTAVPDVLWNAYRSAASSVPTSCHLPVELLAAIGQVESGSLAGRGLDSSHRAVPAVLGPVLDGHGYAAIPDTDAGRWDHDTTWDRAVGPMQFIPSTWSRWGRDGNGDGTRDPQNVEDSAWSAAAYLCAGGRDLSTSTGLRSAVLSYNHSAAYLADVLRLAGTMTQGGSLPLLPAAPAWVPPTLVGPPSRPPVAAAAVAPMKSTAGSASPTTSTTTTRPSTTTTTSPTSTTAPPTTTGSTTATSTTTSSTSSSTTTSPTTSPSPTTCPGTTTASTTTTASPSTTTSPTTTSPSSTTSSPSTTTSSPSTTPDPCGTTSSSTSSRTSSSSSSSSSSAPATTTTATTTSTEGPTSG